MIEEKMERIAAALETISTLLLAQTPQNAVVRIAETTAAPVAAEPVKRRAKKAEAAAAAAAAPVAAVAEEIKIDGDDAEDDFLKEKGVTEVAKKLEVADVRAELVKLQTAPGGNARLVVGVLKAASGVDTLTQLKPEKFQTVIDAVRAHPQYPK